MGAAHQKKIASLFDARSPVVLADEREADYRQAGKKTRLDVEVVVIDRLPLVLNNSKVKRVAPEDDSHHQALEKN